MYWENVDSQWVSQYLPSEKTYIGSADDGGADPQIGHANYDYEPGPNTTTQHFSFFLGLRSLAALASLAPRSGCLGLAELGQPGRCCLAEPRRGSGKGAREGWGAGEGGREEAGLHKEPLDAGRAEASLLSRRQLS